MAKRKAGSKAAASDGAEAAEPAAAPARRSKRSRRAVNYREINEAAIYETVDAGGDGEGAAAGGGSGGTADFGPEDASEGITVRQYRNRLVAKKKELYKDPPVLPVFDGSVLEGRQAEPRRDPKTGEYKFADHPEFRPNLSPMEILQMGSFGGTYFRAIDSAVLGRRISSAEALECCKPEWIKGLARPTMLTSQTYRPEVNKWGVKCGGSLGMWESSGWISNVDPYGQFMWYCNFFRGRRSTDDARQISRALGVMGPKGRFRNQLLNKICRANAAFDDANISPVIRQSLQHWGYEVTERDLERHRKLKGF